MRKSKFILFVSAFLFVFTVTTVIIGSYFTSKVPFISTTGFFIDGIDPDDPDLISTWAEYENTKIEKQIYCFQQYRSSVDYIFEDWRKDMRFVLKADIVIIEMPDSIWNKVNTIWFKSGKSVIKYEKSEMLEDWICTKNNSLIRFTSGESQIPMKTFADGFQSFWNTKLLNVIKVKYIVVTALLFAVLLCLFNFRYKFKPLLIRSYQKLKVNIAKNKKFWTKAFVVFAGTIIAFILVESSLRIFGYFHKRQHIVKNYSIAENSENIVICLGDSFTEGFGSTNGNTYPEVLERLINSESLIEYKVANFGQSGKNTTQIKDEFYRYLENHTPELVVLMAGSANYWNYYGYEDRNKFIYQLRTFKLIKLIWNELFVSYELTENSNDLFYTEENYKENRNEFYKLLQMNLPVKIEDSIIYYADRDLIYYNFLYADSLCFDSIYLSGLENELKQFCLVLNFHKGIDLNIESLDSQYFRALYYYIKSFKVQGMLKTKYLYLSINEFPYIEDVYYQLLITKDIMPVLPSDFKRNRVCILDSLNYYRTKFGEDIDLIKVAEVYIDENQELNIETKKINNWIKSDLEDIIIKCQEKGIKVVLMTYPFKYEKPLFWPVNGVIKELSVLYNIKLIDNFEIFKEIETDNESYYVSDGHCNDRGYSLISNEIFKLLKAERLLKGFDNNYVE
ncbi:MAG: SGNH/GDSL hydrolase family protein [Bacteroidales bacterium]|nr:SGNH/GDSL hydrolase family protein [Bacteroidales bacterium]